MNFPRERLSRCITKQPCRPDQANGDDAREQRWQQEEVGHRQTHTGKLDSSKCPGENADALRLTDCHVAEMPRKKRGEDQISRDGQAEAEEPLAPLISNCTEVIASRTASTKINRSPFALRAPALRVAAIWR